MLLPLPDAGFAGPPALDKLLGGLPQFTQNFAPASILAPQ
jgi:hypothetical protein